MTLESYRQQLNEIDEELIRLLEKRFEISKQIGQWKKQNNKPIEDLEREKQIIESKTKLSQLPKQFIKELFQLIFRQSKEVQK